MAPMVEPRIERVREERLSGVPFALDSYSLPERSAEFPRVTIERECERRYFISRAALEETIEVERLNHVVITQSYLDRSAGAVALAILPAIRRDIFIGGDTAITQVRIRETYERSSGNYRHDLVVKMKCPLHGVTEREEITVLLDEDGYRRLFECVEGWSVIKNRYRLPFMVSGVEYYLEVDIPIALTQRGETQKPPGREFAIIDVETPSDSCTIEFTARQLAHPILSRALDISDDTPELADLRKPISWRRLGEKGFDKRARRALDKLHSIAQERFS